MPGLETQVRFRSALFPPVAGEQARINPALWGQRLAEFLSARLAARGWRTRSLQPEDWGWMVELEHAAFPLWIGCGNTDADRFVCFVEPSRPVRRWFRRIPTEATVLQVRHALDEVLRAEPGIDQLEWEAGP